MICKPSLRTDWPKKQSMTPENSPIDLAHWICYALRLLSSAYTNEARHATANAGINA